MSPLDQADRRRPGEGGTRSRSDSGGERYLLADAARAGRRDTPGAMGVRFGGVIVYVLIHNEANEGGTVEGVYSTEQKARDEAPSRRLPAGDGSVFFWEVLPFEVDGPPEGFDPIRLD